MRALALLALRPCFSTGRPRSACALDLVYGLACKVEIKNEVDIDIANKIKNGMLLGLVSGIFFSSMMM